jgi:hypothetical protein
MYDPDSRKLDEYEFDAHKASFTTASDRVRHLMLISIIASILVFAAYRNAHQKLWISLRLESARVASRNRVWAPDIEKRIALCRAKNYAAANLTDPCDKVRDAANWFRESRHSPDSFAQALQAMEQARVQETQLVKVPFLGIQFDINDLGTFSAMGLSVIAIVLAYSMVRYNENLYLCLWKIRKVAEREGRYDDNDSKANFLYHSLAMAQVFSRAPTLARWKNRVVIGRLPSLFLLALPIIVQSLVFYHDLDTVPEGELFSPGLTFWTIWGFEVPLFVVLLISTAIAFIYAVSADKRWAATFFALNPSRVKFHHPRWRQWVFPDYFPRFRVDGKKLYLCDKNSSKIWQIGCELGKGRCEITAAEGYPDDIFDLTRLEDGRTYELRTQGNSVLVLRDQPATSLHGQRLRVGCVVVPPGKEYPYTLYHVVRDQVEKLTVSDAGNVEREKWPISRQAPRRHGRRFTDLACFGEAVFLVEPRSRNLCRVSKSDNTPVPAGKLRDIPWFPVAIVNFESHLLIAEIPRAGVRWLLRRWKPVRVRRLEIEEARTSEAAPAAGATSGTPQGSLDVPAKDLAAARQP